MAKKWGTPASPTIAADKAIAALRQHEEKGFGLLSKRPINKAQMYGWTEAGKELLIKCVGSESGFVQSFYTAAANSWPKNDSPEAWDDVYAETINYQAELLRNAIEILQIESAAQPVAAAPAGGASTKARAVFVVHGHDSGTKETVARFLEHLDLKAIILHEQADKGRTIIEKFADHSDVVYAIVLLTADDRGGTRDTPHDKQSFRARQNVILEFGYFLAKLGRKGVRALYQEGVEIPSDYSGVLCTVLDNEGAWRINLAREIKAAGIEIDLNNAVD
ncbi:MAG: TIR domain-containing protein [Candidatus Binataceae bacterium]